jgi:hypothetical protein
MAEPILTEKDRADIDSVFEQKLSDEDRAQLDDVFSYHAPTPDQIPKYTALREAAKIFAAVVMAACPQSADRTAALRKVREAVMTANAAVALNGRGLR